MPRAGPAIPSSIKSPDAWMPYLGSIFFSTGESQTCLTAKTDGHINGAFPGRFTIIFYADGPDSITIEQGVIITVNPLHSRSEPGSQFSAKYCDFNQYGGESDQEKEKRGNDTSGWSFPLHSPCPYYLFSKIVSTHPSRRYSILHAKSTNQTRLPFSITANLTCGLYRSRFHQAQPRC